MVLGTPGLTVQVTLQEGELFVAPAPSGQPGPPAVLRGTVSLTLTERRAAKKVIVVIKGMCEVYANAHFGAQSWVTLREQVEIGLEGSVLDKGEHAFEFAVAVPAATATHQRCEHGTVTHRVKATVEFARPWQPSVASAPVPVWLCSNPYTAERELAAAFRFNPNSQALGLIRASVASRQLAVGGLVEIHLNLAAVPQDTLIVQVLGFVEQAFTLVYHDPRLTHRPPSHRHDVAPVATLPPASPHAPNWVTHDPTIGFKHDCYACKHTPVARFGPRPAGPAPADLEARFRDPRKHTGTCSGVRVDFCQPRPPLNVKLRAGEGWTHGALLRMPDDDHLRASTPEGTEARIRVAHRIGIEVVYRVEGMADDEENRVHRMSKEASIASCRLHRGSILLPAYGAPPEERISHPADTPCRCWYTAQELWRHEGQGPGPAAESAVGDDEPDAVAVAEAGARARKTAAATR